ncbi:MAG: sigma 54-interacting transcriptional regulator [Negativicutes bacterium]|nr:sigma 54-interacting transcriptional regulator [Negativicutes bacterium]
MGTIAFLIPHPQMVPVIKKALQDQHQIHVEYCSLNKKIESARKLVEQGYEIIIARAGTAALLKRSGLPATIVELPITGFDIIRAVEKARKYGTNIAVVAYETMVIGIDCLAAILDVNLRHYNIHNDNEAETMVAKAISEGADVILGGAVSVRDAEARGFPSVFIESGDEGIVQAAQEAEHIARAIELEKAKRSLLTIVFDYVHDGLITVDRDQKITSMNMTAQKLLNVKAPAFMGQPIDKIWPNLNLENLMTDCRQAVNEILTIRGLKVLCNKVPIIVNRKPTGLVIAFQDITKIQQAEARIRQEVYNKGHIAKFGFSDIIGGSPVIAQVIKLAREFALTGSNILITGETGTGKEVFSQSIHNASSRRNGPFVAINCAALPGQILESELFGYVAGAFTGATKEGKPGIFELAHGGTILLDEIAEMDYVNQSRLLRVLQERSVMRLGSDRVISIDVRVIAASNKDLKRLVKEAKFREDLFFRLNVLKLELPPLRRRKQDILPFAERFLQSYGQASGRRLTLHPAAVKALEGYEWPGNIRELQNVMERVVAYCQEQTVESRHILPVLEKWNDNPVRILIDNQETEEIRSALLKARGVQSKAAEILGIDRSTLWRKIRRLGITI